MSIRTRIFCGCISLTFVTLLVCMLSQSAQSQLSDKALSIYDDAFQSMNYLRSAQSVLLGISRDFAVGDEDTAIIVDQLQSALDALDVARERAMSERGRNHAEQLVLSVSELRDQFETHRPTSRAQFRAVEQTFDMAVGVYAADGFRLRRSAEALVFKTQLQAYAAMVGSIATAFIITLMLSRAIVPSIRQAVAIASAIASGQLDNRIDRNRPSETGVLLRALASMQDGIAEKIARIETLMAQQASGYVAQIALQRTRFETALDNMTLGLCMFDADDILLVRNRRFSEMFDTGPSEEGKSPEPALPPPLAASPAHGEAADERGSRAYNCALEDGRTIAVAEEAMAGGGRVVTYEDITERQRAEEHLFHMARHDALTGLPNRLLFREHLQKTTSEDRGEGVLSVLCLDLDRFKSVNDTLGHPVGDALLRETAARLRQTSDADDTVVRLGGDEFAVVQRCRPSGEAARMLAERLIAVLAQPFEIDGHYISVGVSIGIAQTSEGPTTPDVLLKNADLALYAAKAAGRGVYRFFEADMDVRVQERRHMEIDLRGAIAGQQFELHYQPILDARTGAVAAFEALLRWHHPERGLVSPADFIPLAEETGLIPVIGLWVLNRACRDAAGWPGDAKVAINLSPLQFQCRNLIEDVEAALDESGLPATRLDLEITESLMLHNTQATLAILHGLRALGISISMDDFGTGYSSLSYLRRFPFDKIKIDRSFIQDLDQSSEGLAIVKAVIEVGHSLQMTVVAEGVETDEQMNLLCRAGCDELQGYLFSRPQPLHAVPALLQQFAERRSA